MSERPEQTLRTKLIFSILFIVGGLVTCLAFSFVSINGWGDVLSGRVSGSWLVISRKGDMLWPFIVAIVVVLSACAIYGFILFLFGLFLLIRCVWATRKEHHG